MEDVNFPRGTMESRLPLPNGHVSNNSAKTTGYVSTR